MANDITQRAAMLDELAAAATGRRRRFEPWELAFIKSVRDSFNAYGRLSERQWETLESIHRGRIDFDRVNRAALASLPALLSRWLPGGKIECGEYIVCNPKRADKRPGSFRININTGKWCDFAFKEEIRGGDPVSLAAYLFGMTPTEAAEETAKCLGIEARNGG